MRFDNGLCNSHSLKTRKCCVIPKLPLAPRVPSPRLTPPRRPPPGTRWPHPGFHGNGPPVYVPWRHALRCVHAAARERRVPACPSVLETLLCMLHVGHGNQHRVTRTCTTTGGARLRRPGEGPREGAGRVLLASPAARPARSGARPCCQASGQTGSGPVQALAKRAGAAAPPPASRTAGSCRAGGPRCSPVRGRAGQGLRVALRGRVTWRDGSAPPVGVSLRADGTTSREPTLRADGTTSRGAGSSARTPPRLRDRAGEARGARLSSPPRVPLVTAIPADVM